MDDKIGQYVQVLLPLKLEWTPWYRTGDEVRIGQRVSVAFAGRPQVGVVVSVGGTPDISPSKINHIQSTATGLPDISANELKLWRFVADYYMCTLGEVFKAAYPNSKVLSEKVGADIKQRKAQTLLRMEAALKKKVYTLSARLEAKISAIAARNSSPRKLDSAVTERLDKEKIKLETELAAAQKSLSDFISSLRTVSNRDIPHTEYTAGKPVLVRGRERISFYFEHIQNCLDSGKDVLVLEPETDLGLNVEPAYLERFPGRVRLFNTQITPSRKRRLADELRSGHEALIVLGMRSALFLPYGSLGLVIVDEEQDSSYKQSEPAPRYSGRDVAAVLSSYAGAQLILGSACPSLESLLNAHSGKFTLAELPQPDWTGIEIIDINDERKKNGMVGDFSRKAIAAIKRCPPGSLVTVVRCYSSEQDTAEQLHSIFPTLDPQILTAFAARKSPTRSTITVVMQADALFERDDFRADEKVLQLLTLLKSRTDRLVVQTGSAKHPVFRALSHNSPEDSLLEERRAFKLPPFTRIVDIRDMRTGDLLAREILARDHKLAARKAELKAMYPNAFFDVDPLK